MHIDRLPSLGWLRRWWTASFIADDFCNDLFYRDISMGFLAQDLSNGLIRNGFIITQWWRKRWKYWMADSVYIRNLIGNSNKITIL